MAATAKKSKPWPYPGQMPAIQVHSSAELDKLLKVLASDSVTAAIHWRLYKDLAAAPTDFPAEISQAQAFWSLTIAAHRDVVLFRLGRLYDQHRGAVGLRNLLDTIKANLHFFGADHFRERLKDNPFVESLAEGAMPPDVATVNEDLRQVSRTDILVARLQSLRNQTLAHLDPKTVFPAGQSSAGALTVKDVDKLIERAHTIVVRYTVMFSANSYLAKIIGQDDYLSVLRLVRRGLEANEDELRAELKRLGFDADGKRLATTTRRRSRKAP